ncbi:Serine acetyltransferase [Symmachiella macrocystis]|uniref:Serine acetyltransferase n=1 Tax=Symmachiella macrocystis TaxID=2527985 RepID=A0A5C6BIE0_9PLAN|nr:hypothetical protein [Symmachiella macrocystis]TWU11828.1 Serine acetyltransferase [Symmachiella macrocystis]
MSANQILVQSAELSSSLPVPQGEVDLQTRARTNQNPAGVSLWKLWREDLATHDGKILEQGFWAMAVHRFGNWRMGVKPALLRMPFSIIYKFLYRFVEWTCGISLPYTVQVGRQVRIWHHSGMIFNAVSIGDRVQLRQNTTFGVVRTEHDFELPIIEAGADIGVGAAILGPVRVGANAVIGANAVVLSDIPPNSVAVGAPAKVVRTLERDSDSTSRKEGIAAE